MSEFKKEHHILGAKRTIQLLNLYAEYGPSMGVNEIAQLLKIYKTTAWKLLKTLESENWVFQDPKDNKYYLGLKPLKLCNCINDQFVFLKIAQKVMEDLVVELDETVSILVMGKDFKHFVALDKVECSHSLKFAYQIGKETPLLVSSPGLLLAAYMDQDKLDKLLHSPLPKYAENTIIDPATIREELKRIRERGYAISENQLDQGAIGISAPIMNHQGVVIACLNISGPSHRFQPKEKLQHFIERAKERAQYISTMY